MRGITMFGSVLRARRAVAATGAGALTFGIAAISAAPAVADSDDIVIFTSADRGRLGRRRRRV